MGEEPTAWHCHGEGSRVQRKAIWGALGLGCGPFMQSRASHECLEYQPHMLCLSSRALKGTLDPGKPSAASWASVCVWGWGGWGTTRLFGLLLVGLPHCFRPDGATQGPAGPQEEPARQSFSELLAGLLPHPRSLIHSVCGKNEAALSGLSVSGQGVAEEKLVWHLHQLRPPGPGGAKAHLSEGPLGGRQASGPVPMGVAEDLEP